MYLTNAEETLYLEEGSDSGRATLFVRSETERRNGRREVIRRKENGEVK
jgi:hypothetical protein